MGGGLWSVMTIVGPILLAAVLLFAVLRNRNRSAAERRMTEQGAHDLRERIDREDKARDAAGR